MYEALNRPHLMEYSQPTLEEGTEEETESETQSSSKGPIANESPRFELWQPESKTQASDQLHHSLAR